MSCMNLATVAVVAVVACLILCSAKSKKRQKQRCKSAINQKLGQRGIKIECVRVERKPSAVESAMLKRESELRKQATAYKRAKQYDKAVESLRAARQQQYKTSCFYDLSTLLRIPQYLILAGRYQEAIDDANDILRGKWKYKEQLLADWRELSKQYILEVMLEAAEKTGSKEIVRRCKASLTKVPERLVQVRIEKVRSDFDGGQCDLGIISSDCGGGPHEPCYPWHGRIISVGGKVHGLPTLADIDAQVVFGGECGHSLEYVDELLDAEEIALQRAHPIKDFTLAGLQANRYAIDIDRYRRNGKSLASATVAVARDRLEEALRCGLIVDNSREIADALTDEQAVMLCPNGRPPRFEPFKATKKEIANGAKEGEVGGVVYLNCDGLTADKVFSVCRLKNENAGTRIVYAPVRHEYVKA